MDSKILPRSILTFLGVEKPFIKLEKTHYITRVVP